MTVIVVEMPLLAPGITCRYCGKAINDSHVYSVDGHKYRCQRCAKRLIDRIEELRHGRSEVHGTEVQQAGIHDIQGLPDEEVLHSVLQDAVSPPQSD